jgi:hypothetical protein
VSAAATDWPADAGSTLLGQSAVAAVGASFPIPFFAGAGSSSDSGLDTCSSKWWDTGGLTPWILWGITSFLGDFPGVDPLVYELFGVFLGDFECVGALVGIFWVVSHPRLRGKSLGRGRDVQVVGLLYCVLTPPALDV